MKSTHLGILLSVTTLVFMAGFWALWWLSATGDEAPGGMLVVLWISALLGAGGTVSAALGWAWTTRSLTALLFRLERPEATDRVLPWRLLESLRRAVEEHRFRCEKALAEAAGLRTQVQLLQKQKRQTEAVFYSLREAVIVLDDQDRLILANEAAGRHFGFDWQTHRFEPIGDLLADHSDLLRFLRESRASQVQAARREFETTIAGRPGVVECVVSAVRPETGKAGGLVAVLHDVTREKEVAQIKNDFISYVSHELKTPLASITAYAEMLMDGEADDETMRQEFYQVIQGQASRLNRLIEDILNVSRIESGLIRLDKQPVSLTLLVGEQLPMMRTYAEERRIELLESSSVVCDVVHADKDMMTQVILNLLSNAIKYNRPGGRVTIQTEVDEAAGVVRLSVSDTGVGIEEDELPYVFDKFYRVGRSENRAEGTGLGLNLVKQIVEGLHGGRVFVRSRVGEGSTFGFELPLATADGSTRRPQVADDALVAAASTQTS